MKLNLTMIAVSAGLLMVGLPAAAHHSFAAEYDSTKKITLKGVVTKFEWTNPHAHFYVDVRDVVRSGHHQHARTGRRHRSRRRVRAGVGDDAHAHADNRPVGA